MEKDYLGWEDRLGILRQGCVLEFRLQYPVRLDQGAGKRCGFVARLSLCYSPYSLLCSSTMDDRQLPLVSGIIRGAVPQVDNFGRYLKQEIESSAGERFTRVLWHPEDGSKLILTTPCKYLFPIVRDISLTRSLSQVIPEDIRMGDVGVGDRAPERHWDRCGHGRA